MDYSTNELDLIGMFQRLKPIPNTMPPVYMLDDTLIGYDKAEKIKIIATHNTSPVRSSLSQTVKHWSSRLVK